jgi:Protein of unknown function (DUF3102)
MTALAPEAAKQIHENLKKISELRSSMNEAGRELIIQMRKAGTALNKVKDEIPYGKWGDWLKQFGPELSSERTAQRYMRIAAEWSKVECWLNSNSATVADLTVRKVEGLLKPTRKGPAGFNDKLAARLIAALKELKQTEPLKAKQAANQIVTHLRALGLG